MPEQTGYYTITEDIKSLIQYVQHYAIKHPVIEAANRLNKAIKKGAAMTIKEYRDTFDEEKRQYAEDSKTHEKPWELWQYAVKNRDMLDWCDLSYAPIWKDHLVYRRKITAFNPKYYSGLNWRYAEHLIGKTVECSNNPDYGWEVGLLRRIVPIDKKFDVSMNFYTYIRTCEETVQHPTINIGGIELPMPETVAPPPDTVYWMFGFDVPATTKDGSLYDIGVWPHDVSRWAKAALKNGAIHLTEERAKAWADWWKKGVLAKIDETTS